jgi:hypothetical protein
MDSIQVSLNFLLKIFGNGLSFHMFVVCRFFSITFYMRRAREVSNERKFSKMKKNDVLQTIELKT